MMEAIFDILFKIAQGIVALVNLLVLCVKPFRSWLLNLKSHRRQQADKEEKRDEAIRCSLRNIITQFYYSHLHSDGIYQYEYENAAKTYHTYKKMGGDAFVDKIWGEIQEWNIIP